MAVHLNLTIPEHQQKFLELNPKLSPSKILQAHIDELIQDYNMGGDMNKDLIKKLTEKRENWQKLFYKAKDFIKEKGFEMEFAEELME